MSRGLGDVYKRQCHKWGRDTWQLSTRASICRECCERKSGEVLGSIVSAQRKARRWIKGHHAGGCSAEFIASISGCELDWVKAEIEKRRLIACSAAGEPR